MLKPDISVCMNDLEHLNKHGIGVRFYQPDDGQEDRTKAILVNGESMVQVCADERGIIQCLVPNRLNDVDVPEILEAFQYTFGAILVPA
jgi:hypothetical protein